MTARELIDVLHSATDDEKREIFAIIWDTPVGKPVTGYFTDYDSPYKPTYPYLSPVTNLLEPDIKPDILAVAGNSR